MQFIGGGSQQEYAERTRGLDPSRCLAAGIDVVKYEALCLALIIAVRSLARR